MSNPVPRSTGPLVALAGRVWRSRTGSDEGTSTSDVGELGADGPVRVVVVEDEPDLRLLIKRLLERDVRFTIVGEAEDGIEGIRVAKELQPDVVLLDLVMPNKTGREALPEIVRLAPRAMTVIVSALQASIEAEPAIVRGAFAYVEKSELTPSLPDVLADLLVTFRQALSGETVVAPSATR